MHARGLGQQLDVAAAAVQLLLVLDGELVATRHTFRQGNCIGSPARRAAAHSAHAPELFS